MRPLWNLFLAWAWTRRHFKDILFLSLALVCAIV
jgi:hypothetical protein